MGPPDARHSAASTAACLGTAAGCTPCQPFRQLSARPAAKRTARNPPRRTVSQPSSTHPWPCPSRPAAPPAQHPPPSCAPPTWPANVGQQTTIKRLLRCLELSINLPLMHPSATGRSHFATANNGSTCLDAHGVGNVLVTSRRARLGRPHLRQQIRQQARVSARRFEGRQLPSGAASWLLQQQG